MAIDVAAQIRYWRDGSADDLEAARTLLDAGKIRQAGFFVHLPIEKAVKACAVAATRDLPPRSHDLLSLVQRTGIALTEGQRDFMGRVQMYCLEGRYPTELPPPPAAEAVAQDLQRAGEMIQWLTNRLNSP
ncbi:MAG: HEPN domain-containing protein [Tepidisphaeraceae bacterium]